MRIQGSKGCIAGTTQILMSDFSEREAAQLVIGNSIKAFGPDGKLIDARVCKIDIHQDELVHEYNFWGQKLICTPSHWVQNQFGAFVEVGTLTFEDAIINVDGHLLPLLGYVEAGQITVYEIHVEPYATLIGNKLRIHNGGLGLHPHIRGAKGGGGKGGGGGTAPNFHEDPNTLRSKTVARVLDLISEGPIVGPVNGAQSVKLDGTPLQNADGTYNFQGFSWDWRDGTPNQTYMPGFVAVEEEITVGVEITNAAAVTRTITDPTVDALRVKVRIPQLTRTDTTSGSLYGSQVQVQVWVKPDGGSFTLYKDDIISGKCIAPYERQYRIDLPAGGAPWDVRFVRVTEDSDSSSLQNKTFWSSYTKLTDAKLNYPDSAIFGLTLDAEFFGDSIPLRSYVVKGLIIQVPSNYDPETRIYTGIWDGTFQLAWTNNPAWILYDILTNPRYGLGQKIDALQVDKWSLYTIGKYCDEMVDDGFGGLEPRFTFNGVINTRQQAYAVINAIASCFRGMAYWGSGAITATQDSPADSAKLVTPANVIDGMFNYSGSSLKARHTAVLVTWNDPEDAYRPAVEVVEDADGIERYGWRQHDMLAYGCSSRGQARRMGKWLLDSEKNETEMVNYRASFDHFDTRPGAIIAVADPHYAGARMGGKITAAASSTSITVDQIPSISPTDTNTIMVVMPDGSISSSIINSWAGNVLTLAGLADTPSINATWVITTTALQPRQFRVISVSEIEKNIYEVTGLLHDSTKYARIEENIQFDTGNFTILRTGRIPTIGELKVFEYLYLAGVTVKSALTISWTPPDDPRAYLYQIEVKAPGEAAYATIGFVGSTTVDLFDTQPGTYSIRVKVYSALGDSSDYFTQDFIIRGLLDPPDDVETLLLDTNNGQLLLNWSPVADLDLDHYTIRYNSEITDVKWENSQDIAPNVAKALTSITLPNRNGTYLIKAIDASGIESENAIMAIMTTANMENINTVADDIQHPTFAGTYENTFLVGDYVQLSSVDFMDDWTSLEEMPNLYYGINGVNPEGFYESSLVLDLGAKYPVAVTNRFVADAVDLLNVMSSWGTLSALGALNLSKLSDWATEIQISLSDDNVTWSDWVRLQISEYEARYFKTRAWLQSFTPTVTPRLKELQTIFDMPDRIIRGTDIVSGAAPKTITYDPPFMTGATTPSLGINPQNMQSGDYWVVSAANSDGFTVTFYDSTNTMISRTFDFTSIHYGIRTS